MRTTLTLADDVAALLARVRSSVGGSLKNVVNEALRRGLAELIEERPSPRKFRTRVVALQPRHQDIDNVADVLARAEGEAFS